MKEKTAIFHLQRFFSKDPTANSVSVAEAISAFGRNPERAVDRHWLSVKLSLMREYRFVDKDWEFTRLVLTPEGKEALARDHAEPSLTPKARGHALFNGIVRDLRRLRRTFPDFEFTFEVRERAWAEEPQAERGK